LTYEITPAHFGFTTRLRVLLALGTLARPSWAWTPREIVTGLLTWLFIEFWWYVQHNYSLEVDEDSVRVVGGRVIRKGRVRYLREFNRWPWRGGTQLVLSEHAPAWVPPLFGGAIVIPKGLPEYEQVKQKVSTWMANSADGCAI